MTQVIQAIVGVDNTDIGIAHTDPENLLSWDPN